MDTTSTTPGADAPALPVDERRPRALDWAVVVGMVLFGSLEIFINHDLAASGALSEADEELKSVLPLWGDYLAFLALIIPVVWRRVAPAPIALLVGVGFAAFRFAGVPEGPFSSVAVFMTIHAVGAYEVRRLVRDRVRVAALSAGFVALAYALYIQLDAVSFDGLVLITLSVGLNVGFYVAAWFLGDAARTERSQRAELSERADQLAAEREKVAAQAVTEERVRIARELHDVVAHHVSVMGVQAAGARHVMAADPDRASAALEHVEESGRLAVSELQRLVGVLRSDEQAHPTVDSPQPTLNSLDGLVESMRSAGLDVTVSTIGRARPLPSSVELSAYRIVQEALTNVVRHAPGAQVAVVLSYLETAVGVEVVNGVRTAATPPSGPGGGRGLLGMRERVAMLGGELQTGPIARGGFRVKATLPAARAADAVSTRAAQTTAAEVSR